MKLSTTDIYESSFFHCSGAELVEVWGNSTRDGLKVVFTFKGNQHLEELQKSYYRGTATVNLADYRDSLEKLKDIMFTYLRKENQSRRTSHAYRKNKTHECV